MKFLFTVLVASLFLASGFDADAKVTVKKKGARKVASVTKTEYSITYTGADATRLLGLFRTAGFAAIPTCPADGCGMHCTRHCEDEGASPRLLNHVSGEFGKFKYHATGQMSYYARMNAGNTNNYEIESFETQDMSKINPLIEAVISEQNLCYAADNCAFMLSCDLVSGLQCEVYQQP